MTENLKNFLLALGEDSEWLQQVKALTERQEAIDAVVAKAAELGVPLTAADFEAPEGALSEDELANLAGGACNCMLAGLGPADIDRTEPQPSFPLFVNPDDGQSPFSNPLETPEP